MATVEVPLTQGRVALIDEADLPLVGQYKWCASWTGYRFYAQSWAKGRMIYMHRLITNPQPGMKVDHRNHDGLDNRRENLRVCTNGQNMQNLSRPPKHNKTGFIGVRMVGRRFKASISANGRRYELGGFDTAEKAAIARDRAARELHGEFARLNFDK